MSRTIEAHWEDWDGQGRQHVILNETGERVLAEGSIRVSGNAPLTHRSWSNATPGGG